MNELTSNELSSIRGGGLGLALGITAGIIFLIGIVDGYVRPLRCNKWFMVLSNSELSNINGGINITGVFLSSLVKGINSFLELGRSVGSAFRRIKDGNLCSL